MTKASSSQAQYLADFGVPIDGNRLQLARATAVWGTRLAILVRAGLRRRRRLARLSQEHVAQLVGSHRPIVARVELGKHVPTLDVCAMHAAQCGGLLRDIARAIDRAIDVTPRRRVCAQANRTAEVHA